MSTLRHPHIVEFLGVCFLPCSRMVMEKLATSLHDNILDPEPPPPTKPVSLKCSVLHDVAEGSRSYTAIRRPSSTATCWPETFS